MENYSGNLTFVRGKTVKIRHLDNVFTEKKVNLDGDPTNCFKDFIFVEQLDKEIEIIFNAEAYFKQYETFKY